MNLVKKIFFAFCLLCLTSQVVFSFQGSIKSCQMACCAKQQPINNEKHCKQKKQIKPVIKKKACCRQTKQQQNYQKKIYQCNCSFDQSESSSLFTIYQKNLFHGFTFLKVNFFFNKVLSFNEKILLKYFFTPYSFYWSNLFKQTIVLRP